jgi:polyisoprenoid-binding protein YceI
MKLTQIAFILTLIPLQSFAATEKCKYSMAPDSVKVEWTAFKTTEKTPVHGNLKEVKIESPSKAVKSLKDLLSKTKASGQIDSEKKSDSGNPARDLTLLQKFFSLIASNAKFGGTLNHFKGNDQAGDINLNLSLNGKKKDVAMKYTLAETGAFEAVGEFDMIDFGMTPALESIHQACETLHKGKDGVSKTWPNVGIKISANIKKECSK